MASYHIFKNKFVLAIIVLTLLLNSKPDATNADPPSTVPETNQSLTNYANNAKILFDKGHAFERLGEYVEAIKCYDKVIEIEPKFANAWFRKGGALERLGKFEKAIECYDNVIEINVKDARAWSSKGGALERLERSDEAKTCFEEAIKCYNEVIEIKPKFANAWYNKGNALERLERYDEAIECYDEATKTKPKFANAWSNKGRVFEMLGKFDEAIKCYDKVIEINPKEAAKGWKKVMGFITGITWVQGVYVFLSIMLIGLIVFFKVIRSRFAPPKSIGNEEQGQTSKETMIKPKERS